MENGDKRSREKQINQKSLMNTFKFVNKCKVLQQQQQQPKKKSFR